LLVGACGWCMFNALLMKTRLPTQASQRQDTVASMTLLAAKEETAEKKQHRTQ